MLFRSQSKTGYVEFAKSVLKKPLLDPTYRTAIANSLLDYQEYDYGKATLDTAFKLDSRDLSTLWGLALFNEIQGNFTVAINFRLMIEKYDPWNAKNFLQLLNDYLKVNDTKNAELTLKKINSFAANTDEGKQANTLINSTN